jgi:hypothetical protein
MEAKACDCLAWGDVSIFESRRRDREKSLVDDCPSALVGLGARLRAKRPRWFIASCTDERPFSVAEGL